MAHVDASTDIKKSIYEMSYDFKKSGGEFYRSDEELKGNNSIEVTLIGGTREILLEINEIRNFLTEKFQISSLNQDILTGEIENAWLDLETGKVSSFKVNNTLKSNEVPPFFGILIQNLHSKSLERTKGSD